MISKTFPKQLQPLNVLFALLLVVCANMAFADGTSTVYASTRDDACLRAKSLASDGGQISSGCSCESRGDIYICRVQYTGQDQSGGVVEGARKIIREKLSCNPDEEDCTPRNGGSGRRG